MDFEVGDLVYHMSVIDEDEERRFIGHVTGFCPGPQWVRVRTNDGRKHIWLKEHVENISSDERRLESA
jgi:hypothetical protein